MTMNREALGAIVRRAYLDYNKYHPRPLVGVAERTAPWSELDAWSKDMDRRIGWSVAQAVLFTERAERQTTRLWVMVWAVIISFGTLIFSTGFDMGTRFGVGLGAAIMLLGYFMLWHQVKFYLTPEGGEDNGG